MLLLALLALLFAAAPVPGNLCAAGPASAEAAEREETVLPDEDANPEGEEHVTEEHEDRQETQGKGKSRNQTVIMAVVSVMFLIGFGLGFAMLRTSRKQKKKPGVKKRK